MPCSETLTSLSAPGPAAGELVILCNINILNVIYELCCVELRQQKSHSEDLDQFY